MIISLPQSILQAEEIEACSERILSLITKTLPAEPALQFMLPLMDRDRKALKKALSSSRSSAFTQQIAEADEVRDDAFVVFRNTCETATRRRSKPDLIAAGQLLMRLIEAQGYSLQAMGYSAQTGVLNSLFDSLKEAPAVAAIAAIGAGEVLSELVDA